MIRAKISIADILWSKIKIREIWRILFGIIREIIYWKGFLPFILFDKLHVNLSIFHVVKN